MKEEMGFTLIELIVSLVVGSIISYIIYTAYAVQIEIYTNQDYIAEMQQQLRAGMSFLQRDVRMTGYNHQETRDISCGTRSGVPGIHTATEEDFGFSMDFDRDGTCNGVGENVTYSLYTSNGIKKLGRDDNNNRQGRQAIAENIINLHFFYIFSHHQGGDEEILAPNSNPPPMNFNKIVAVQVSMLAQSREPGRKPEQQVETYTVPMPDTFGKQSASTTVWRFSDTYIRRMLTTTIYCRNMGLD